ncbi:hypothetical protein PTKIN_Ptkin15bG0108500 [Pterospermum kingtungense]
MAECKRIYIDVESNSRLFYGFVIGLMLLCIMAVEGLLGSSLGEMKKSFLAGGGSTVACRPSHNSLDGNTFSPTLPYDNMKAVV